MDQQTDLIKLLIKFNGMKTYMAPLLFLVLTSACTNTKNSFWNSSAAYLGQIPPTDTPKIFATGMLTDSGIVLGRVAFSKNGKEFYYGYASHWFDPNGSGIKQIIFDGGKWSTPKVLFENLSIPTLSTDETKLYLAGNNSDVWQSERTPDGWKKPIVFLNKRFGLYNFQPTNSGTFYVGSNADQGDRNDYNSYDFCTLTMSTTDTIIKSLGLPLNTRGFDGDFYVAPDESYMIVSAKETPDYDSELHISFRKPDKTWTDPTSLGPLINDGIAHRFGQYVSPDGKYLFYTKGTTEKDTNIYWVRFDDLLQKARQSGLSPM